MKSTTITAAALVMAACSPPIAPAPEQSAAAIDAELNQAEQRWAQLAMKPDDGLLERILADDYAGMSERGTVRDKRQEIAYWASQPGSFASATPAVMVFRHYGDTVIGQGRQTLLPTGGGAPLKIVWTDTWMRRNGQWQVVSAQDSVVAPAYQGDDMG